MWCVNIPSHLVVTLESKRSVGTAVGRKQNLSPFVPHCPAFVRLAPLAYNFVMMGDAVKPEVSNQHMYLWFYCVTHHNEGVGQETSMTYKK